jgi:hypothetical protein
MSAMVTKAMRVCQMVQVRFISRPLFWRADQDADSEAFFTLL